MSKDNFPANTYMQLIRILNQHGFMKIQKSVYMNNNTTSIHTWNTMVALMAIEPPGKFETTVDGLMMQYVHQPNILIITPDVQLGGFLAQSLRGLTPRNLVTPVAGLLNPPPVIPPPPIILPRHTRPCVAASVPAHWNV